MKPIRSILAAAVLLALSTPAFAQPTAPRVALKGTDPVSYFKEGPQKGAAAINYDFDDARYLFASPANKVLFASSPARYTPQFAGLCAAGLASGHDAESDPSLWKIIDGKLYVFSSVEGRSMAENDRSLIGRAQANWKNRK